ncbi:MAG TPA: bacteriohemerythrin [Magnetovibrio sp.]
MNGFGILLRVTAIILMVEGGIMLVLSRFPSLSIEMVAVLDVVMLMLISAPIIFWFVIKPYADAQTRDLRQAKETAEAANRAKDEFLSHMNHELRTPLNAVIGFAQLLQHNPTEPLSEAQKDYTNCIIGSGEHLLEIINGMLDMAAIEANRLKVEFEDVTAISVCDASISLMKPAADNSAVTLVNNTAAHADVFVHTDPVRLKQALINLLSNAIKYNVPNGSVTLDASRTTDGMLRLSVTDTGRGIAPKYQDRIFKPFDRLDIETKMSIEGTGIGLSVTKKLIELLGARIGFVSEYGVGSTFWIEVPVSHKRQALPWNNDLLVGIEQLDNDHRKLVSLVNEMSDHALNSHQVDAVLDALIEYTQDHFAREETVMEACGYPMLLEHQTVHRNLAAKVTGLAKTWRNSEDPEVMVELLDFLRGWLVKHIMETDKQITPYTKGHEAEIKAALEKLKQQHRA